MVPKLTMTYPLIAAGVAASVMFGTGVDAKTKKVPVAPALFDIEMRKKTKRPLGPSLSYSGYLNGAVLQERNRRRDDDRVDTNTQISSTLGVAFRAQITLGIVGFVHGTASLKRRWRDGATDATQSKWAWKEAHLSFGLSPSTRLTVGRMRFSDVNKWATDAAVDGVHVGIKGQQTVLEFAAVTGTRKNTSRYLIGHIAHATKRRMIGALAIYETDGPEVRWHLSGYRNQSVTLKFAHQWNVGLVLGDAANNRDAGLGLDWRGVVKLTDGRLKPQLIFGFAYGTPGFRQTGLHSNKTYDGGQMQFHRYGYVYQPNLTNIAVASVSYGIRPSRQFSMDVTAHLYAQPSPSTVWPDARIKGRTTGASGFLGGEIGVIGAWRPSKKSKVEFGAAKFLPGPAYEDRSSASRIFARYSIFF